MFGPKVYDAFRRVKRAFDPDGIMNPGKIVDPAPMTENLRIDPAYRAVEPDTGFSYASQGGFGGAIEMCTARAPAARSRRAPCAPPYMVTRDEEHSTRGRANALRAAISGALPLSSLTGSRLYTSRTSAWSARAVRASALPTRHGQAEVRVPGPVPQGQRPPRQEQALRQHRRHQQAGLIHGARIQPRYAFPDLRGPHGAVRQHRQASEAAPLRKPDLQAVVQGQGRVYATARRQGSGAALRGHLHQLQPPEIGRAATKVLERLGYEVALPDTKCCGRPMLSAGMMDAARKNARANVDTVHSLMEGGAKLVGLEPSCILGFRDDYLDLLPNDRKAAAVAEGTMLLEEFLHSESGLATADLTYTNPPVGCCSRATAIRRR